MYKNKLKVKRKENIIVNKDKYKIGRFYLIRNV